MNSNSQYLRFTNSQNLRLSKISSCWSNRDYNKLRSLLITKLEETFGNDLNEKTSKDFVCKSVEDFLMEGKFSELKLRNLKNRIENVIKKRTLSIQFKLNTTIPKSERKALTAFPTITGSRNPSINGWNQINENNAKQYAKKLVEKMKQKNNERLLLKKELRNQIREKVFSECEQAKKEKNMELLRLKAESELQRKDKLKETKLRALTHKTGIEIKRSIEGNYNYTQ